MKSVKIAPVNENSKPEYFYSLLLLSFSELYIRSYFFYLSINKCNLNILINNAKLADTLN